MLREIDFTSMQKGMLSGMTALLMSVAFLFFIVMKYHSLKTAFCFAVPFALFSLAMSPGIAWLLMQKLEKPAIRILNIKGEMNEILEDHE